MSRYVLLPLALAGAVSLAAACSATNGGNTFDDSGSGGSTPGGGGSGTTSDGAGGFNPSTGAGSTTGEVSCTAEPDEDFDQDSYSINQGDCNDCDENVNPGAIEVVVTEPDADGNVPEPADEDCDEVVDNLPVTCDDTLALEDPDPLHGAFAVELCKQATAGGKDHGLLSAQYVRADGSAAAASQHLGILEGFGPNVHARRGARVLALSSGRARIEGQPGACNALTCTGNGVGSAPPGFPQDVPGCAGATAINDDIALEVRLRAPTNATGYKFNFKFYTFEYPEWVCTAFNDQFISLVSPAPMGSVNGNVSFDSQLKPVSVNVAYFDVCAGCPLGTAELAGTGFGTWNDAGGTGWLVTQAPVSGGEEISIRWAIWDTGDTAWDSTALVDGFEWIANGGTVPVETVPVPE